MTSHRRFLAVLPSWEHVAFHFRAQGTCSISFLFLPRLSVIALSICLEVRRNANADSRVTMWTLHHGSGLASHSYISKSFSPSKSDRALSMFEMSRLGIEKN